MAGFDKVVHSYDEALAGFKSGKYEIMEGPEKFTRYVVIEFPTMEQAIACNRSAEYQQAAEFRRHGAGEVEQVIVEGGEYTR